MNSPSDRYRSSYVERLKANVARVALADKEALFEFRRAMYGASSVQADPSYFEWMFERAPGVQTEGPPFWIYRSEGRIDGQQGAIPVTLNVNGERRPAMWALDLMVRPELHMRGIGPVLDQVAFGGEGIVLGMEVSQAARSNYLRSGWVDTGTVPLYTRALLVRPVLKRHAGTDIGREVGAVADGFLRGADAILRAASLASGLRCEEVSGLDERAARLWERVSASIPIAVERDLSYLDRRYNAYPKKDRYRPLYFFRGGELCAWVVTRVGSRDGLREGFLVDYAGSPRDLWCALAQCLTRFRAEGVAAVYCLQSRPAIAAALQALGFLRRDSGWRLMARPPAGDAAMKALFAIQSNWFITFGDSDADRPREGTIYASTPRKKTENSP